MRSSPISCIGALSSQQPEDLGLETDSVAISAARIYTLLLADEQFNTSKFYSQNDRNLRDYDVEIYDNPDGTISVVFSPPPRRATILGCPSTGPVDAGFTFDAYSFALKHGHLVC